MSRVEEHAVLSDNVAKTGLPESGNPPGREVAKSQIDPLLAAPIPVTATEKVPPYSCFCTSSHRPRPHMLGHSGRVSPSVNCAGVLQTLHQ